MKRFLFEVIFILGFGTNGSATSAHTDIQTIPQLPKPEVRKEMVVELSRQIERIDGEGLLSRKNRTTSWQKTIELLGDEALQAKTMFDFGRVFKRFDATYPNLHAHVYMIPEIDERNTVGAVKFSFKFLPVSADRNYKGSRFRITIPKGQITELHNGDELLAINSRPLQEWTDENFNFCKFPFREQCEIEFFDNFRSELLSWNRHQPLEFTIRRNKKEFRFEVAHSIKPKPTNEEQEEDKEELPCGVSANRYKGFTLAYQGEHLCAFESAKNKGTVVLRIDSFVYQDVPFAVLDGEVQIFWNNYWKKNASSIKTLILDVIENGGGQSPIPYYGLFYSKPYQELYVQFKKIKEFEQKEILESFFLGDKGKEIWFENIKKDQSFANTREGGFLSHIPQFCSSSKKDCREGLFEPRKNNFMGKIKILMNHWCISSCVGFVYNVKELLKDRVQTFGIPDSGDSAYSRLSVFVSPLENGKIDAKVGSLKNARKPDKPEPWVRQVAAVTRSTDKDGNVISGQPQKIDFWVSRKWNQTDDEWAAAVFDQAMGK